MVFLPELTLSRYPAFVRGGDDPGAGAEDLRDGPTVRFATEAAGKHGVLVHASLYERDGRRCTKAMVTDSVSIPRSSPGRTVSSPIPANCTSR